MIVGKTRDSDFHDLRRFGVMRGRTEHEMFIRSLLGQKFGPLKPKAKAKAKPKNVPKRKVDLKRAAAIILTGKPPVLPDVEPVTEMDGGDAVEPVGPVQIDMDAAAPVEERILECVKCRLNRHVSDIFFDFYSARVHLFECQIVGERCRKLRRLRST